MGSALSADGWRLARTSPVYAAVRDAINRWRAASRLRQDGDRCGILSCGAHAAGESGMREEEE